MKPFLALIALSADIKHFEAVAFQRKVRLDNSRRSRATPQHVLIRRQIALSANLIDVLKEPRRRVRELEHVTQLERFANALVLPQDFDVLGNVGRDGRVVLNFGVHESC